MARHRIKLDETKVQEGSPGDVPEDVLDGEQVTAPHRDSYAYFQDEAEGELNSHRRDTMFVHKPEDEVNERPSRMVYQLKQNKHSVSVTRGVFRKIHKTTSLNYVDTIRSLYKANKNEIERNEVEIELHKRLLNEREDGFVQNRLEMFGRNLEYLKVRSRLLGEMLTEAEERQND